VGYLVRSFKYRLYPKLAQQAVLCKRQPVSMDNRVCKIVFPALGNQLFIQNSRLHLPGVGGVKIKLHRELPGKFNSVTIRRETSGRWYAVFSVVLAESSLEHNCGQLELCKEDFKKRLAYVQRKLEKTKLQLANKQPGSRNWNKQLQMVARLEEKLRFMQQDWWHKETLRLARLGKVPKLEEKQLPRWIRRMWEYKAVQIEKKRSA
jgi:transposase